MFRYLLSFSSNLILPFPLGDGRMRGTIACNFISFIHSRFFIYLCVVIFFAPPSFRSVALSARFQPDNTVEHSPARKNSFSTDPTVFKVTEKEKFFKKFLPFFLLYKFFPVVWWNFGFVLGFILK